ncbi:MAG: hypothetical protein H8E66_07545 [Planctomycetes bacterium]|nr:hypothetical protein [Planctomycetota bacterium]
MRTASLILAVTLATCSFSHADQPIGALESETEASLKILVERLEARIDELESQVQQLKHAQRSSRIGASLLESMEPAEKPQLRQSPRSQFKLATHGQWNIDEAGIIRDFGGRPIGYWGFDFSPVEVAR